MCCLMGLFAWWGSQSVKKYWSQPLVTDIDVRIGDFNSGIQFPLLTFCNENFFTENYLSEKCYNGNWNLIDLIVSCMKSLPNFSMEEFMENVSLEAENIVETSRIWTGSKYINFEKSMNHLVWSRVYVKNFGLCFTFYRVSRIFLA